jgi:hypothetical protein
VPPGAQRSRTGTAPAMNRKNFHVRLQRLRVIVLDRSLWGSNWYIKTLLPRHMQKNKNGKQARDTSKKKPRVSAIEEALSPKDRFVLESQNRNLKSGDRIACSAQALRRRREIFLFTMLKRDSMTNNWSFLLSIFKRQQSFTQNSLSHFLEYSRLPRLFLSP